MSTNIGFNVHKVIRPGVGYSAADIRKMLNYFDELQPHLLLFMDWDGMAYEAARLLPNTKVVLRVHNEGDRVYHLNMTARKFYDWQAKYAKYGVIIQLLNEPDERVFTDKLTAFCNESMDLWGSAGLSLALPTFGTGGPYESLDNLMRLAPLWEGLKKWKGQHKLSGHEYGTHRGIAYIDPKQPNPGHDTVPWRVGRHKIYVAHCQRYHGFSPEVAILEWGANQSFYPGDNNALQGWRDYWTEEQYADELIKADQSQYLPFGYIMGQCIYSMGDTGGWEKFNVWGAETLLRRLLEYSRSNKPPTPPASPPVPTPPVPMPPVDELPKIAYDLSKVSYRLEQYVKEKIS